MFRACKQKSTSNNTYILSFWNSDDVTDALHTVSLKEKANEKDKYEIYNDSAAIKYNNEGQTITQYINQNGYYPLVLQCVSKKE